MVGDHGRYAAVRRQDSPAITPGSLTVDHRRATAFGASELSAHIRAGWDLGQDIRPYIEAVHRLSDLGAACSYTAHGVSRQGFDAEWQGVNVVMVDGDMVSRTEYFDEADLDAAIAKFEELSRPAPRLENTATRRLDRVAGYFAARDWAALGTMMAPEVVDEDRRRTTNAGVRHGRDAIVGGVRTAADLGAQHIASTAIAIRGDRLALCRFRYSGRDQRPEAFYSEALGVFEIDVDERVVAHVAFDIDDFDAAIAELDARYLAGEAAAHAHVWSVITSGFGSIRRYELPPTTPDCVSIDHRRTAAFAPGELNAYFRAAFDLTADAKIYVESVHRLNDVGAVCTYVTHGVSHEGFAAEWREVNVLMVEGDVVSRCELYDEADLEAAVAKFEELSRPAPRLENAASQMGDRFLAHFAAGEWDAMAETLAENLSNEDRRRVVSTGIFDGRDAQMANARAIAELWSTNMTRTVTATRGRNLALARLGLSRGDGVEAFVTEFHSLMEIDANDRISAIIVFDVDDFDAAIAELDARYLAGEAAAHARTWSAIAEVYAAINRGEIPATAPDLVDIDHRSLAAIGSGDLMAYLRAASEDTPWDSIYIETVHRLTDLGAVTTHVAKATSREGFDAEWRITSFFIVGGDLSNRYEIFDEDDLDTALARFDELNLRIPGLQNAASQVAERFFAYFGARNWEAIAATLDENVSHDDRRHVVNAGVLHGRDAQVANLRAIAEVGVASFSSTAIATRGARLALVHTRSCGRDERPEGALTEELGVVEINSDDRMVAYVAFDANDFDSAIAELDARYLAGEAAQHSEMWSTIMQGYAALNRQEIPGMTPDAVSVDHRRGRGFTPGELPAYLEASWKLMPQNSLYIDAVHRLTNASALVTHVVHGTTQQGFDAEWREIAILQAAGNQNTRCEMFDEEDFDAALARFEELQPQARRLENEVANASWRTSRPATGMPWRETSRKTITATIAVGS